MRSEKKMRSNKEQPGEWFDPLRKGVGADFFGNSSNRASRM